MWIASWLVALSILAAACTSIGGQAPNPTSSPTITQAPTPTKSPAAAPSPTEEPSLTGTAALTGTPFLLRDDSDGIGIYITMPEGWEGIPGNGLIGDPDHENTGIIAWFRGGGWVYGDPCHWSTTTPDGPVTTVDEITAALASQASRDASEISDVTVGGYAGKSITLHVPDDIAFDLSIGGDGGFTDCDRGKFGTMTGGEGGVPESEPGRWQQGPGQIDEYLVVDVDGVSVIYDLTYWPDTPQGYIDEMRAVVESATYSQ